MKYEINDKIKLIIWYKIYSKNEFNKSDRYNYIMMEQNKTDDKKSINNIFYNSTRSIFTVLFCFLLLGPIGCLGYVILDNYLFSKSIKDDIKSKKENKNVSISIAKKGTKLKILNNF